MFRKFLLTALFTVFGQFVYSAELQIQYKDQTWSLDSDQLLAIAPATLTTQSPWDDAPSTFSGIYLNDLLHHISVNAESMTATALNDYEVSIDVAVAIENDAFIAVLRDGKPMPIRNKGPFWIIFPWGKDVIETKISVLSAWSIWQLKSLQLHAME